MGRNNRKRRDTSAISNHRLPSFVPSRSVFSDSMSDLSEIEDRRRWHPEGEFSPARGYSKLSTTLTRSTPNVNRPNPRPKSARLFISDLKETFTEPKRVAICVRRQIRKEVLHALRQTGGTGQNRPTYNANSMVSCQKKKRG